MATVDDFVALRREEELRVGVVDVDFGYGEELAAYGGGVEDGAEGDA